ncbi:MAG TPA: amine dehydrogenase large subunit [Candidatus Limnocylindrales bacterium]|nr:amine dehydrogenase large subunit [Candidatus Limnocylindrales bacterium]
MNRTNRLNAIIAGTSIAAAVVALAGAILVPAGVQAADIAPEKVGNVFELPAKPGPSWFWASDILLHRTALYDAAEGRLLGTISSGSAGTGFVVFPLFPPAHDEIYLAETYWSRGIRGERTDVVTVYDARTLKPKAEIPIPAKRGEYYPGNASNALTDDGRFMAVFNITPATSLSIVDVKERRFAGEVEAPGCSLVYSAGPRRFFMLCANGSALVIDLDDRGGVTRAERTEPFFDSVKDPITEKGVRRDNEWIFTSYDGVIHTIDVKGPTLAFGPTWSLTDDADRSGNWRIGGLQHLAVHAASGRLYVLMHQGPAGTHKDPGTEIWVYDLEERKRIARFAVPSPLVTFIADQAKLGAIDKQPLSTRATRAVLEATLPNVGAERILVTQEDKPLLIASSGFPPTIAVLDAETGAVEREIQEPGVGFSLFFNP